jgi:glycosyltransferase involved in cell wall biosynthesis
MKIAFIIHVFPRIHNTFISNEIIELIKRGHKVSIFSSGKPYEKIVDENITKYNLLENTHYFDDFISFRIKIVSRIKNLQSKDNKDQFIEDYSHYFKEKKHTYEPIAELIKKEHFDIIHAGFGNNSATTAMILSERTKTPFTFECHAYDLFVDFPFAKEKIANAAKIFTISDYNKQYLINNFRCPETKIIVKRVTINETYFSNMQTTSKRDDLIVSVCRLHPIKGLEYAIDAFNLVLAQRAGLEYVIIGDGPLHNSLKEKVEKLGLNKNIIFLGTVENTDVFRYMKEATLFLLPSVIAEDGDRDGIPTSLIEAMCLKTPVISSKISGIPELIDDGIDGFLVEPKNVDQIAKRIDFLLSNKDVRERMGEKARDKVNKMFDTEVNINKLLKGLEHEQ